MKNKTKQKTCAFENDHHTGSNFLEGIPSYEGMLFIVGWSNTRHIELSAALSFTTAVGHRDLESLVWRLATMVIKGL